MADTPWILTNPILTDAVYPFLLIFFLIYAILRKTQLFGDDSKQTDALISLAIALIFVTFSNAVGIVQKLMPVLAIMAVVILMFMILMGFISGGKEGFVIPLGVRIAGGIIILIVILISMTVIVGWWDKAMEFIQGNGSSQIISTAIFLVFIGGAVAVVLSVGKNK
jgi:hypothetical protein